MEIVYSTDNGLRFDILGVTAAELGDMMAFLEMYKGSVSEHNERAKALRDALSAALDRLADTKV